MTPDEIIAKLTNWAQGLAGYQRLRNLDILEAARNSTILDRPVYVRGTIARMPVDSETFDSEGWSNEFHRIREKLFGPFPPESPDGPNANLELCFVHVPDKNLIRVDYQGLAPLSKAEAHEIFNFDLETAASFIAEGKIVIQKLPVPTPPTQPAPVKAEPKPVDPAFLERQKAFEKRERERSMKYAPTPTIFGALRVLCAAVKQSITGK